MADAVVEAKDILSVVNKGDRRTVWVMFVAVLVVVGILAAFEAANSKAEAMVDARLEAKVTPTIVAHSQSLSDMKTTMDHIDSSLSSIQQDVSSLRQEVTDLKESGYFSSQPRRASTSR